MDGRYGAQCVLAEYFVTVNSTINCPADTIVIGRDRQYFELIVNTLHALNPLNYVFSVGFQGWPRDLAEQSHGAIWRYFVRQIIKHAIKRQHYQFVMYLFDDAVNALLTQGSVLSTGRSALSVRGGGGWGRPLRVLPGSGHKRQQ